MKRKRRNIWCWMFGCLVVESYDASPWCTRCGGDVGEFHEGVINRRFR